MTPPQPNSPPGPGAVGFLDNSGLNTKGRKRAWAGCRGGLLTRWRAPQGGFTSLHNAALHGHLEVMEALVKAGMNKDSPDQVREGRGGDVGRTNVFFFFFAGGYRKAADCQCADKGRRTVPCSIEGNRLDPPPREELGGSKFLESLC